MSQEKYRLLCQKEDRIPLFSRDWWLDIVCGEANWDAFFLEEKGKVRAVLPFYSPLKGIITMPQYTQTMGPWFVPESSDTKYTTALSHRQQYCKLLVDQLKPYACFLQNFHHEVTDWLPFYWGGYRQTTRYTYLLRKIANTSALWEQMSLQTRRNIMKAKDEFKITVRKGIPVEDFLRIQSLTFKRQHTQNKQRSDTLRKLIDKSRLRKQGELYGGYDEQGTLHAVAFIVWQKSSAYYLAGGGDPSLRSSGAHSVVLWEAIRDMADYTDTFDFEGSMIPGVERFFREFGAIQMPYFTISKGKMSLFHKAWLKLKQL